MFEVFHIHAVSPMGQRRWIRLLIEKRFAVEYMNVPETF